MNIIVTGAGHALTEEHLSNLIEYLQQQKFNFYIDTSRTVEYVDGAPEAVVSDSTTTITIKSVN